VISIHRRYYTSSNYRYGFNGQEREQQLNQSITSAEYWIYDGRLGRRWNVDPRTNPSISNYACFANNPLIFTDLKGDTTLFYNMANNELLGTYNDASPMKRIKVNAKSYNQVITDYQNKSEEQNISVDGCVNYVKSRLNAIDNANNNVISYETGNFQLDFTGSVITDNEMTGKELGTNHADYAIQGTMSLNSVFDDGSTLAVETYNFNSGPYGNGPTPNHTYVVRWGTNGQINDGGVMKDVWTPSTLESGMKLHSGGAGWKLRLNPLLGRSGLLIHPDCNGAGTAGCIGINEDDVSLIRLGNFFDNYIRVQRRTLNVNFYIPDNPNYGNNGNANPNLGQ